jgi:hypothetical protein
MDHRKVLVMFDSFLDESGIHEGAKVCVIGGYFAGKGEWRKFEKLWERTLAIFEVPLDEFHAKELAKGSAFFHGWSPEKCLKLQSSLALAIAKYKLYPVAQGVLVEEFLKMALNECRFMTGATLTPEGKLKNSGNPNRPYFAPFQQVVRRVLSYAPAGGKAHFFFGLDRPFAQYATQLYSTLKENDEYEHHNRFGDISFPLAKETPALQAADLLVHTLYLDMLHKAAGHSLRLMARPSPFLWVLIQHVRHADDLVYDAVRKAMDRSNPRKSDPPFAETAKGRPPKSCLGCALRDLWMLSLKDF